MMRSTLLLLSLSGALAPFAFGEKAANLEGFVTDAGSPSNYRVNAVPVHCTDGKTLTVLLRKDHNASSHTCPQHVIGEGLEVIGTWMKGDAEVEAKKVEKYEPVDIVVQGVAIVDRVLQPLQNGQLSIRADGYPLLIGTETALSFPDAKLKALSDVGVNVWVQYAGSLHPDGTVTVARAEFRPNLVQNSESKLRSKNEFAADKVGEEDRQGGVSKFFLGWDAKRIPAYGNEEMQQRVDSVGNKLIPAYQKSLPEKDPTRIAFRFQLVDQPKVKDTFALPSGIVLVPYQIVQRVSNDSQLAALLSAGISEVLQKQALRAIPSGRALTAASLAGSAAGLFVPGLGLVSSLATSKAGSTLERHRVEQRTRLGLALMADSGFDLAEAPVAWWTLEIKKDKPLMDTKMPYAAQYLYTVLSTAYRGYGAGAAGALPGT